MTRYIVSYDLHKIRNYQPLYDLLNGLAARRLLESVWLVYTSLTADQLRNAIVESVDNDDSCAVIEIVPGKQWATWNGMTPGVEWMERALAA